MGAFHELSEMSRDYGLGIKYFLLVGGVLAAMMMVLFLWGRVDTPETPAETPAQAVGQGSGQTPAVAGPPSSY